MGLLDDIFSGRSSDIYGNGLLTPEQRGGLGNIGLLALAGKLGQLAGPSFSPVPDFGAALGQAAGAYGASQEGAGTAALNAILTGQKGRKLEQELDYYKQLGPVLGKLAGDWPGAGGGAAATPETGTSGYMAASPGAGGGGSANGTYWTPEGLAALRPTEGRYDQIHYPGGNPSTASGAYGFLDSTWREQAAKAGVDINQYPRAYLAPPTVQDRVAAITPIHHWTGVDAQGKPFNAAAQRLATNPNYVAGAAPAAAAPAGTGTRGLLAPTAPNPLSDADPIVGTPKPTAAAPQAAAGLLAVPWAPGNLAQYARPGDRGGPVTVEGVTYPSVSAWNRAMDARATATGQAAQGYPEKPEATGGGTGQGASEEPPGFAGRQLVAQLLARPPIDDLSQYRQVAGPGAADAAAPRAPLPTMGPAGIELPPMQGPLAAPAPAAAAPGPGLLSPGALPGTAAAIPRGANPAFDTYLRNLATAGTLAEGAGLKNVFGPMIDALTKSPSYQAELERAKARVGVEFAGPKAEAEKAVELRYAGAIAAAVANGQLPSQLVLHSFDAQNAVKAALAAKGLVGQFDEGGNLTYQSRTPGADIADTAETAAKGRGEGQNVLVPAMRQGPNGPYEVSIPRTQYIDELNRGTVSPAPGTPPGLGGPAAPGSAAGPAGGVAAPGAAPVGGLVGKPYLTPGEISTQQQQAAADVKAATEPGITRETETQRGFAAQDTSARAQALAAREGLYLLGDARQQLEGAGIFSGALANPKMTLAQYYSGLTGVPNQQLINTQVFLQQAGARSAAILQAGTYGTGTAIGARDLDAANKLANGDNTVDLESIKRVFDLTEKTAHRKIEMFNDMIRERDPRSMINPPSPYASRAAGAVPAGLPPGSVPAGNTKDGKPAFRSPDGKIWSE